MLVAMQDDIKNAFIEFLHVITFTVLANWDKPTEFPTDRLNFQLITFFFKPGYGTSQQSPTERLKRLQKLYQLSCQGRKTLSVQQISPTTIAPSGKKEIISVSTTHHKKLDKQ